ncbi:NAD(P)-binding domain-containing protein [Sphingopyxis sp. PET50]|uniref:NAD(P)-binding domain-containing protein n=1 Tax=Sphingopyxis sp. PET50 TaxID=2976533 RepID=UPI0028A7D86D|nr:NAD(P)-binding domain-containing protein [Sphingopyxis sp. PET50]
MTVRYHRAGIAGTGRVARAMALALAPRSAKPVLVWGRSPDHAREAAAMAGGAVAGNCAELAARCDLIVIAVADDALVPVVAGLADALVPGTEPFVCHVGGGSGAAILAPLHERGVPTAAVHPAMTFTGEAAQEVERMA